MLPQCLGFPLLVTISLPCVPDLTSLAGGTVAFFLPPPALTGEGTTASSQASAAQRSRM